MVLTRPAPELKLFWKDIDSAEIPAFPVIGLCSNPILKWEAI